MRLVQVLVPTDRRDAVHDVLDDLGIDYAESKETSDRDFASVVTFPLPTGAVEDVLDELRAVDVDCDAYTVVVDAETVVSERFEELVERYESDGADSDDRIARDELVARASDLAPEPVRFVELTVLSAVVAVAGLLLDSPAVIVGSMVIAPLVGPAMTTAVGTVVEERGLFARGVKLQSLGVLLTIAVAAAFGGALRAAGIAPAGATAVFAIGEVQQRLTPGVLSLGVGLAAGAAGAISLSTGVSTALVGVMIAAALVPPTAVVGIGIAWGDPGAVAGSAALVLVNVLSINLAGLVVLRASGYDAGDWLRNSTVTSTVRRRGAVLVVAVALVSLVLVGVTDATGRTATFEQRTEGAVATVVDDAVDLRLLRVEFAYASGGVPDDPGDLFVRTPERVTVRVAHPVGADPPPLADRIGGRIATIAAETLGRPAPAVEVQFVATETRAA